MKVYVAGPWRDRQEIGKIIEEVQEEGHTITHDWTKSETLFPDVGTAEHQKKCAAADMLGVLEADAVLVVMKDPYYQYSGTWTEVGAALVLCKTIILYTPWLHNLELDHTKTPCRNVFFYHELVHKETDWKKTLEFLKNYARFFPTVKHHFIISNTDDILERNHC